MVSGVITSLSRPVMSGHQPLRHHTSAVALPLRLPSPLDGGSTVVAICEFVPVYKIGDNDKIVPLFVYCIATKMNMYRIYSNIA